ncbi:MAG TPA: arylamine N-acetyltransferase [Roseiarcus sp.]|nr:arylamine N-acetyltransferase [Roseiarcus sp.]
MGRSDAMWVVSCSAGWVGSHLDLSGVGTSVTASSFDQQAWFDRIGYNGSREPTLGTLHQLIFAHSNAIAYESLDIMLGRSPNLDLVSLQRKMIFGGRGGYCLEQNMLFREGLRSLGYKVTSLQGRVVRGMAIDAPRPAIHMLLQVEMPDGPYLADVGFGNLAPTSALLLREGIEQPTPHEPMRFINVAGELTLQAKLRDTWEHIYRVIPYPRYDGEYEIVNWYTSTHPDAPYKSNIIAARPGPNRTRITMFNRRLTVRYATGEADRRHLKDEAEFRSVLRREFGLNMTDEEIRACIEVMERKGEKGAPHPFFA